MRPVARPGTARTAPEAVSSRLGRHPADGETHIYHPFFGADCFPTMTTVFDVPATPLIEEAAKRLADHKAVSAPEWAPFVKTGIHREKPPVNEAWWNVRVAAVLRKVYVDGPIGTERLRAHFGGTRDRGSKPDLAVKGSGSIARKALQQLEAAGLIQNVQGKGRAVTAQGRSLLDNAAHAVRSGMQKELPALAKY